jgi:ssDNA-binding Zn-finger/Zn-ribbon topoisomerase 1
MTDAKLTCPECGSPMQLRNSKFGPFYGCTRYPDCTAAHGAHPDGRPLGVPANKETKRWRIEAHTAFDALWQDHGPMKRKHAYKWMQETLGLTPDEAHIGSFDIEKCQRLIAAVKSYFTEVIREEIEADA